MQIKHLIVFALVGIVALLSFNLVNGYQHDKNREIINSRTSTAVLDTDKAVSGSENIKNGQKPSQNRQNITKQRPSFPNNP